MQSQVILDKLWALLGPDDTLLPPKLDRCRCGDYHMHDGPEGRCLDCPCPEFRRYESVDQVVMQGATWD